LIAPIGKWKVLQIKRQICWLSPLPKAPYTFHQKINLRVVGTKSLKKARIKQGKISGAKIFLKTGIAVSLPLEKLTFFHLMI
jgi:hypothetical protein